MSKKTKAIILVIVLAIIAMCALFINTSAKIESFFAKVGAIVVAAAIIALAVVIIVRIKKSGKKKAEEISEPSQEESK